MELHVYSYHRAILHQMELKSGHVLHITVYKAEI